MTMGGLMDDYEKCLLHCTWRGFKKEEVNHFS